MTIACGYNNERTYSPNGRIPLECRLECEIRILSGADPLDLISIYGISKTEVHASLWYVVDAVCMCEKLNIVFPQTHQEQQIIAEGFRQKSGADISKCCGAIDGMLVWLKKPNNDVVEKDGCNSQKFYCWARANNF